MQVLVTKKPTLLDFFLEGVDEICGYPEQIILQYPALPFRFSGMVYLESRLSDVNFQCDLSAPLPLFELGKYLSSSEFKSGFLSGSITSNLYNFYRAWVCDSFLQKVCGQVWIESYRACAESRPCAPRYFLHDLHFKDWLNSDKAVELFNRLIPWLPYSRFYVVRDVVSSLVKLCQLMPNGSRVMQLSSVFRGRNESKQLCVRVVMSMKSSDVESFLSSIGVSFTAERQLFLKRLAVFQVFIALSLDVLPAFNQINLLGLGVECYPLPGVDPLDYFADLLSKFPGETAGSFERLDMYSDWFCFADVIWPGSTKLSMTRRFISHIKFPLIVAEEVWPKIYCGFEILPQSLRDWVPKSALKSFW